MRNSSFDILSPSSVYSAYPSFVEFLDFTNSGSASPSTLESSAFLASSNILLFLKLP